MKEVELIKSVWDTEGEAISRLRSMDMSPISSAIDLIFKTDGKIVVSGMGKSAIVAQKMVATLNSTGTSAIFLHSSDALHGDIGVLSKNDILFIISKSGGSQEIKDLILTASSLGLTTIALCSNSSSILESHSNVCISVPIEKEADLENLAPTASIVAHIAVCDAIAIALQKRRNFTSSHFAKLHPKGTLGKQLTLKALDIAQKREPPSVDINEKLHSIIYEISSKRLGACCVLDGNKVVGIITDGDIRRMLESNSELNDIRAFKIMTKSPKWISPDTMAIRALQIMKENSITQLIISDEDNNYLGLIHLHDLLHEGLS